jgi:hypothetical protein
LEPKELMAFGFWQFFIEKKVLAVLHYAPGQGGGHPLGRGWYRKEEVVGCAL